MQLEEHVIGVPGRAVEIEHADLETCAAARGVVVAIDVLRAYTTAAYALAAGAGRLVLVSGVDEALALRRELPGALAMGEVDGIMPPGFDLGNSPAAIGDADVHGRTLVFRSTAGTQAAVRAADAAALFGASFVCAGATARAICALEPRRVTLVNTGYQPGCPADDDAACADYLAALLRGEKPDAAPFLLRARRSVAAQKFIDPVQPDFSPDDLELSLQVDRFDFALRVLREDGLLVLRVVR